MELMSDQENGCYTSARGALPARKQLADCPSTGSRAVTRSKYIDCWFTPILLCDVCHSKIFSPVSIRKHDMSPGDRCSGRPVAKGMNRRGQLFAKRVEEICIECVSATEVRRVVPARVAAGASLRAAFPLEASGG